MGLRSFMRGVLGGDDSSGNGPVYYGPNGVPPVGALTVETLWRTQPHLRTVVSFLAENIAHVGFHMYERVSPTDRRRVRDDPFAMVLRKPNDSMTGYDLWYDLVSNLCLYNEAFWVPSTSKKDGRMTLESISPSWVIDRGGKSMLGPEWFRFMIPGTGETDRVPVSELYYWPSFNPGNPRGVSSPVEALKQVLYEQIEGQRFRRQLWQKGGRFGGYLTRPVGARWDPTTRDTFRTDWNAKFGGEGTEAGGTPILEDGMEYKTSRPIAKDEEWIEGIKLALSTVATVYHVNPTMIGILDNANFANVREFRRALYGDTLGPWFERMEQRMTEFVMPDFTSRPNAYIEANVGEKLQGSFEEQTKALQTSVGRPWMTADEARALQNLPSLGGDAGQLVTPLNVLIGGQASPNDSAPTEQASREVVELRQVRRPKQLALRASTRGPAMIHAHAQGEECGQGCYKERGVTFKAEDEGQQWESLAQRTLKEFFARQGAAVSARLGAKADDWWDEDRWNRELATDLFKVGLATVSATGPEAAEALGFKAEEFDVPRTENYLKASADMRAKMVNTTTKAELDAALEDPDLDPDHVFEVAESSRSLSGGSAYATALLSFATLEVAHQLIGDDKATKTWLAQSRNSRASHAAMDGETVGLDEVFSNGANMPGDPAAGADEVAGCMCGVEVSY